MGRWISHRTGGLGRVRRAGRAQLPAPCRARGKISNGGGSRQWARPATPWPPGPTTPKGRPRGAYRRAMRRPFRRRRRSAPRLACLARRFDRPPACIRLTRVEKLSAQVKAATVELAAIECGRPSPLRRRVSRTRAGVLSPKRPSFRACQGPDRAIRTTHQRKR